MSPDPLRYFRIEARELVDQISAGVLDLDQRPGPELVARLLRFAHTLKGAARVVRQQDIADRAHAFEEVLVAHRAGAAPLPADEIRELLRLNDEMDTRVSDLGPAAGGAPQAAEPSPHRASPHPASPQPAAPHPTGMGPDPAAPGPDPADPGPDPAAPGPDPAAPGPDAAVPGATPPEAATPEAAPAVRGAAADVDELLDAVGDAHARFAPLRGSSRDLARLHRSAQSLAGQLRGAARSGDAATGQAAALRLADELAALGRRLTDAVEQVERELDEIRGRAERLRLVAASSIFTALHRAVRDVAEAQGKRVIFDARGGDLRMDPQVLAQAATALLHVVRNGVVHGIEDEAGRTAAGKPVEGRIVLAVERRSRYAAFRCSDDGRGFDLDAVRRTAEASGLLPSSGRAPDEQSLVDLVLQGGISTSSTVTEVAGRGIGLDVARDVAQQLGGEVSVRTAAGTGTTVQLVVPLSLVSLHGLVVAAGGVVATVPLDAIRTCVRLSPAQATAAAAAGRIAHEGHAVPYLPLARALGGDDPGDAARQAPAVAVLVVADGDVVAVGVDRLSGTSTLVVRPLPDLAPAAPFIGGVSIDLDGNPQLVLDAAGLVAAATRHTGTGTGTTAPVPVPRPTERPVLVVDDSLTTRMLERSILESAGYQVDLAASGEEGLEMARLRPYGLFLTDIDMPGMDGFTFVERTRADPALAGVPVILVSSRSSLEDRERGAAVGAAAYIVKGEFNQEELLAHIRKLVPA